MKHSDYRKMMGLPPPGGIQNTDPVNPLSGIGPQKRPAIRMPRTRTPNKTEAVYGRMLRSEFPDCEVIYEGVSFKLPGGNYTPDWTVWRGAALVLAVEVKGGHRFNSAGRSHMAFKAAAATFPFVTFRFAQLKTGGTWTWLDSNTHISR